MLGLLIRALIPRTRIHTYRSTQNVRPYSINLLMVLQFLQNCQRSA